MAAVMGAHALAPRSTVGASFLEVPSQERARIGKEGALATRIEFNFAGFCEL